MNQITAGKSTSGKETGSRRISLGSNNTLTITGKIVVDLEKGEIELRIRENGEGEIAVDVLHRVSTKAFVLGSPSREPMTYAQVVASAKTTTKDSPKVTSIQEKPAPTSSPGPKGSGKKKSKPHGNSPEVSEKAAKLSKEEVSRKIEREKISAMKSRLNRLGINPTGDTSEEILAPLDDQMRRILVLNSREFKEYAISNRLPGYGEAADRRKKQESSSELPTPSSEGSVVTELPSGDAGKYVRSDEEKTNLKEPATVLEKTLPSEEARVVPFQGNSQTESQQIQADEPQGGKSADSEGPPPGTDLPPVVKKTDSTPIEPNSVNRKPVSTGKRALSSRTGRGRGRKST